MKKSVTNYIDPDSRFSELMTPENQLRFGECIERWRTWKHVSVGSIKRSTGISQPLLSRYETGRSIPRYERAEALARMFGITIDDLRRARMPPDGRGE